ncbi:MAG: DPP IV N-terminal domain-containing protein, partial [Prolixibacteraceae bacterium]
MRKLLILFLVLANQVNAQQKQMTLEDAILGRYGHLRSKSLVGLTWKDASTFTYLENDTIWAESVKKAQKVPVVSLRDLNRFAIENNGKGFRSHPQFSWEKDGQLRVSTETDYFLYDVNQKQFTLHIKLPSNAENSFFSSKGKFAAYTVDDDLYATFSDGKTVQITTDGGNGIVNGKTVHRVEFGISKGIFISPGGNYIAFYRKDESMVHDYPLVDYMTREAEYTPVKYPMAGQASHHVKVGVYNVETGETSFLNTGTPLDKFLTNVAWSPNEEHIFIAELNRLQNHMRMNKYAVSTGKKVKTLFEERHENYVEPLHPVLFSKTNENEMYYLTRRDGWFHVYKYNSEGKLLQQVTKGEWEVTEILGFDDKEQYLFVEATKENPLEIHIYRVEIKSGEMKKLTTEPGIHDGLLNPQGDYILDDWEAPGNPGQTDLLSVKEKFIRTVHQKNDPLVNYLLGENTLVDIKSADGKYDLTGRLIKPVNFDPNQKYPVVVYVYGGPHSQLVNKSWHNNVRWWQYYMASQGFVSFTMDNRGTSNRGREFETAIHRQ